MERKNKLLLGQIALEKGMVTPEQLNQCLDEQAGEAEPRRIGAVLVAHGYINQLQLTELIDEQLRRMGAGKGYRGRRKRETLLGYRLVRARRVAVLAVNEALRAQQDLAERGIVKPLGEILVDSGHLTASELQRVLRPKKRIAKSRRR